MKFIKYFLVFILIVLISGPTVFANEMIDFSKTDVIKSYEKVNEKDLEAGVQLYQYKTVAYNDGIKTEDRLNDYDVSWLDYGTNTNVRLVSWSTKSIENWTGGRATDLASDYEKSHPGYLVAGAINGDFFHIRSNHETCNTSIQEGELLKPVIWQGQSLGVLGWTKDGKIIDGIPTISNEMYLEVLDEKENKLNEKTITAINKGLSETGISLLTKDVESDKNQTYDFSGYKIIEITYDIHRYSESGNENHDRLFVKGLASNIEDGKKDTTIKYGTVILAAKDGSLDHIELGDTLRLQYHLTDKWSDVYNTTGYYAKILNNGKSVYPDSVHNDYTDEIFDITYVNCKKNRTIIGKRPDGSTILMTVEYNKQGNYGASYHECAEYLRSVGCVEGWLLDGGGSTSMAIRNGLGTFDLIAGGSDGHERSNGNAILIVVKDPGIMPTVSNISRNSAQINLFENDSPFRKDVTDIKIEVNGETKEFVDGKATFDNLEENKMYQAKIKYKMKLDDGTFFEGVVTRDFTTLDFPYPNVSFDTVLKSDTEVLLKARIRKSDKVEISNIKVVIDNKEFLVNEDGTCYITGLKKNSVYTYYATFDCKDVGGEKVYNGKSYEYNLKTEKVNNPLIYKFTVSKHAGTKVTFDFGYNDVNNKVQYAYVEFFGSVNKVTGKEGSITIEGIDVTYQPYTFTFRLVTDDGEIISHEIVLEKLDKLPPSDEVEKPTEETKKCGKKCGALVVELTFATAVLGILLRKKH